MKRRMTKAVALSVALALLGMAVTLAGWRHLEAAKRAEAQSDRRWRSLVEERAQREKTAAERQQLERRWQNLQTQGFFESPGHSPRLVWAKLLRQIQTEQALPSLQAHWRPPEDILKGEAGFRRRAGSLTLELNHELELPAVLETLRAATPALIRVRECEMQPDAERLARAQPGPNLRAQCALEWVTGILPENGRTSTP